jgi:hypothetical protein
MMFNRNTAARPAPVSADNSALAAAAAPAVVSEIAHSTMRNAFNDGRAVALTDAITDIVWYDGSWWLFDRDSWLRVTDTELAADLDAFAARSARR